MPAVMERKHERGRMYGKDYLKGELARLPAPGSWLIHWLRWEKGFWLLILTARQI